MDRFTRVLAGLLGRSARLLPAGRRDWAEALLAEAGEIPDPAGRVGWVARRAVAGGTGGLDASRAGAGLRRRRHGPGAGRLGRAAHRTPPYP